jgi:hypothetical protein
MVAVQTIMMDQNEDEVGSLKSFKEHPWIFAYNGIICCYKHPIILVEARNKYLKGLQCKTAHWTREEKHV